MEVGKDRFATSDHLLSVLALSAYQSLASIASIVVSDLDESKVSAAFGRNFGLKDVRSCFNSLQENLKRTVWRRTGK